MRAEIEGPGLVRSFGQGLFVHGPRRLEQAAKATLFPDVPAGTPDTPGYEARDEIASRVDPAPHGPGFLEDFTRRSWEGLAGPVQSTEGYPMARRAEAFGTGLTEAGPFAPFAAPLGPLAVASEIALGGLSEMTADELKSRGHGAGVQFAGSLLAGMASPATITRSTITSIPKSSRQLAAMALRQEIPNEVLPVARQRLLAETKPDIYGTTASPAQALEGVAPGIRELEEGARTGPFRSDLTRELAAQRRRNLGDATIAGEMEKSYYRLFDTGEPGELTSGYATALEDIRRSVSEAAGKAGNVVTIPTGRLKVWAKEAIEEAGEEGSKHLPKSQIRLVSKYDDVTDLDRLRRLRSSVTDDMRVMGVTPRKRRYLMQLRDEIDTTLEEVARASGDIPGANIQAFRRMVSERAKQGRLFGENTVQYKALVDMEDPIKGVKKILNSPRPVETLEKVMEAVSDNEAALDGLRTALSRAVFGEGFQGISVKTALNRLRRKSVQNAMDAVFGDGTATRAEYFFNRLRQLESGRVGTTRATYGTGSGVIPLQGPLGEAASRLERGSVTGELLASAARKTASILGREATRMEAEQLIVQALTDPRFMLELLDEAPPMVVPVWAEKFSGQTTSRAARSALGTGETE